MNPHIKSVDFNSILVANFVESSHRILRAKRELLFMIRELEKWSYNPSLIFPTRKHGWKLGKKERETKNLPSLRVEELV